MIARIFTRPCTARSIPSGFARNNVTPILLPSRAPELKPVENIWQYLRQTYLSSRVFEEYDDIVEAACQAWNQLIDKPWQIMSIGLRQWAHSGQLQ